MYHGIVVSIVTHGARGSSDRHLTGNRGAYGASAPVALEVEMRRLRKPSDAPVSAKRGRMGGMGGKLISEGPYGPFTGGFSRTIRTVLSKEAGRG